MELTPESYECPTHHRELADQVRAALEEEPPPVAYRPRGLWRGRPGGRPFEVVVTCPGTGPDSAHSLTCAGTYR